MERNLEICVEAPAAAAVEAPAAAAAGFRRTVDVDCCCWVPSPESRYCLRSYGNSV